MSSSDHERADCAGKGAVVAPFLAAAILAAAAGCGGSTVDQGSPESTVRAFAIALGEKKYEQAYELMSRSYRRRVSLAEFKSRLKQSPDEAVKTSLALSRTRGRADQRATLAYGESEQLNLVREKGKWRIADNVVDFYDQSTPRAALRTFVRAMERQRYDVVLRLVPNADKEGITIDRMREAWSGEGREEVERMLSNLRENLDNPLEQVGQHATMPYGDRYRVQFIREDGVWKIEDPE
jgi:hypothetical protein